MKRRLTLATVAVGAMLALSACGGGDSEPATAEGGVPVVEEGKLTTCTHLSYQPFQFEKNDEVVGFDVDIVDAVAKKLGVEQEILTFHSSRSRQGPHSPRASAMSPLLP